MTARKHIEFQTTFSWHHHTCCPVAQVAFDDQEKIAYLIGGSKLYIIDLYPEALLEAGAPATNPKPLSVLDTATLPTTINDVVFCDSYLANGETKVLPGSVTLYSRFLRELGGGASLQELAKFTVGEQGCSCMAVFSSTVFL